MKNITDILSVEASNRNNIHLYQCGEIWYAYEHSAYHFLLIFKTGKVEKKSLYVFVTVDKQLEFLSSQAIHSVQITTVDNNYLKIDCLKTFSGFRQWKQNLNNIDHPISK